MRSGIYTTSAMALMCLTTSCARNTIALDRATTMGQAGKAATERTTQVLDELRATNREVLIDLAASDPNCVPSRPRIARGRTTDGSKLCRVGAEQPGDFELRRWTRRELAPSLAVIDGIATYLGAVDAIVTRKPVDIGAEVAEAEEKLRAVSAAIGTIAGTPALPEIAQDQRQAVEGTLKLLSELIDEAGRVKDLRRLEGEQEADTFARSVAALEGINVDAVRRLGVQLQNQQTLLTEQLRAMRQAPLDERRPVVARYMDVVDERAALPELAGALQSSVEAFDTAHAAYIDLLLRRGALTPAEQRKAAGIAQARVLAALQSLAAIVKAF